MPMPRANVQSLGAHVSNMAGSARSYVFGNNSRNSKQNGIKPEPMMDDDDSSSGSDSDSDMSDGEGTENFLSKINAATAAKKTNAAAKGGAKLSEGVPTTATATNKTSTFKSEPNGTEKKIKTEPTTDTEDDTSSSDSSSESDSEEEKTAKKSVAAAKKAISKPEPKKAPASSDSDSSSDSDHSDDEQSGAKVAAPQNSKQPKATANNKNDSSSSDESEDESEEEAQVSKQFKKATKPAATVPKKASESSTSDSESESESESDSDNAQKSNTAVPATRSKDSSSEETSSSEDEKSKPVKAPATKKTVNGAAISKFKKPADDSDVEMADESFALVSNSQPADGGLADEFVREGFQLRKASEDTDVSEVLNLFKQAKREGKQIWYFTTPASVPVSVVEKMNFPMRNAQTGEPIVSHNGVDYGVDLGATGVPSTYKILVPAKKGSKYEMDRGIDHTMHLKRITQLAASDFTAKPKAQITAKPPRPQPAVLKKRYTPIGVPTPILPPVPPILKSRGDVAMTDAPDAPEDNGSTSGKKSKKRKANAQEVIKTPLSETKSKKAKTINSISADPSVPKSTPPSSTPTGTGKKPQAKGKKTATTTPVSQAKARRKSPAELPRTQTPVPLPKMPGLKR